MKYRRYRPEDFAQLYAIEERCFEPPYRFGRGYMRRLVNGADTATWIAELDGRMTGFAIVEWSREAGATTGYIQTIEVLPEDRGQGAGAELLRLIENSARDGGAEAIFLHVDAENAAAIRLYEARGYRPAGREENYYPRGRAALIYAKGLLPGSV